MFTHKNKWEALVLKCCAFICLVVIYHILITQLRYENNVHPRGMGECIILYSQARVESLNLHRITILSLCYG